MAKPLALIIEDDLQLVEIYSLALQAEFDTETFTNGEAALTRLGQIIPAIIVLDLNLPTISGFEILRQIHNDERMTQTRVIIATADSNQSSMLSNEADTIIFKPVSPMELRELAASLRPSNT